MVAFHDALKPLAAAGPDDIDSLAIREDRDVHLIAGLGRITPGLQRDFATNTCRRHTSLLEVALRRLVLFGRLAFDEAELHRLVSIRLNGLRLYDHARAGLQHGRRVNG